MNNPISKLNVEVRPLLDGSDDSLLLVTTADGVIVFSGPMDTVLATFFMNAINAERLFGQFTSLGAGAINHMKRRFAPADFGPVVGRAGPIPHTPSGPRHCEVVMSAEDRDNIVNHRGGY